MKMNNIIKTTLMTVLLFSAKDGFSMGWSSRGLSTGADRGSTRPSSIANVTTRQDDLRTSTRGEATEQASRPAATQRSFTQPGVSSRGQSDHDSAMTQSGNRGSHYASTRVKAPRQDDFSARGLTRSHSSAVDTDLRASAASYSSDERAFARDERDFAPDNETANLIFNPEIFQNSLNFYGRCFEDVYQKIFDLNKKITGFDNQLNDPYGTIISLQNQLSEALNDIATLTARLDALERSAAAKQNVSASQSSSADEGVGVGVEGSPSSPESPESPESPKSPKSPKSADASVQNVTIIPSADEDEEEGAGQGADQAAASF